MATDSDVDEGLIRRELDFYHKTSNYLHWRLRCLAEKEETMGMAHRLLHEGEKLYEQAEQEQARAKLLEGLQRFEVLLNTPEFSTLRFEDNLTEEIMWGIMLWRQTYLIYDQEVPASFPLKDLWLQKQSLLPSLQSRLSRL